MPRIVSNFLQGITNNREREKRRVNKLRTRKSNNLRNGHKKESQTARREAVKNTCRNKHRTSWILLTVSLIDGENPASILISISNFFFLLFFTVHDVSPLTRHGPRFPNFSPRNRSIGPSGGRFLLADECHFSHGLDLWIGPGYRYHSHTCKQTPASARTRSTLQRVNILLTFSESS